MKLNLSVRKIVDKEFKKKPMNGYDAKEVDEFLDLVIEDYETIAQYIAECKEMNKRLRDENYRLKKERLQLETGEVTKEDTIELTNSEKNNNENNDETMRLDELEAKINRMETIILNLEKKDLTNYTDDGKTIILDEDIVK